MKLCFFYGNAKSDKVYWTPDLAPTPSAPISVTIRHDHSAVVNAKTQMHWMHNIQRLTATVNTTAVCTAQDSTPSFWVVPYSLHAMHRPLVTCTFAQVKHRVLRSRRHWCTCLNTSGPVFFSVTGWGMLSLNHTSSFEESFTK